MTNTSQISCQNLSNNGVGGQGKFVKKGKLWTKIFYRLNNFKNYALSSSYYKPSKNRGKKAIPCYMYELMRPSISFVNLANLKIVFIWLLFEENEFTANAKLMKRWDQVYCQPDQSQNYVYLAVYLKKFNLLQMSKFSADNIHSFQLQLHKEDNLKDNFPWKFVYLYKFFQG